MFKKETITLENLHYRQLDRLIAHFRKNDGLSALQDKYYSVTAVSPGKNWKTKFNITFPRSWVKELPMEEALKAIMGGDDVGTS